MRGLLIGVTSALVIVSFTERARAQLAGQLAPPAPREAARDPEEPSTPDAPPARRAEPPAARVVPPPASATRDPEEAPELTVGEPRSAPAVPAPDVTPFAPAVRAPEGTAFTVRSATAGTPPDIVLTNEGGMARGTIIRSVPGRSVEIRLETGEIDSIPWSMVRFAGPAAQAPGATSSAGPWRGAPEASSTPTIGAGGLAITFESNQRATLHAESGTATATANVPGSWARVHARASYFDRLCTAPCALSIEPGVHRFAISMGEHEPIAAPVVDLHRPGRLVGRYVANGGLRAGGWTIFVLGLLSASGAGFYGVWAQTGSYYGVNPFAVAVLTTASVNLLLALLVGLPMATANDGAVLRFE